MEKIRQHKETLVTATQGILGLLKLPRYTVLALIMSLAFAFIIFLAINSNFYLPLFLSQLPILDKLNLVGEILAEIFRQAPTANGGLLILVSILQGLSIAILIFTTRRNKRNDTVAQQISVSGLASVAAAIGLGCVPCGTSLILPIVTLFFSGAASAAAASVASSIVLIVALGLSFFSLYKSGQIAFVYVQLSKEEL